MLTGGTAKTYGAKIVEAYLSIERVWVHMLNT